MSDQPRVLLTVESAAQQLSIGRTTMFRLVKTGEIASVRIGNARRIPADAIDVYIRRLAGDQRAA